MQGFSDYKKIKTHVHGVSFGDRQKIIRRHCKPGMQVTLKREPHNRHSKDGTAIGVWVTAKVLLLISDDLQIGYIPDRLSHGLAPIMDEGGLVFGKITEITGGTREKPTIGVNIELEAWKK